MRETRELCDHDEHIAHEGRLNICRACHLRHAPSSSRSATSYIKGNVVNVNGKGELKHFNVLPPKDVVDEFQSWCYENGWSIGLAFNAFIEHLLLLEKVPLPLDGALGVVNEGLG